MRGVVGLLILAVLAAGCFGGANDPVADDGGDSGTDVTRPQGLVPGGGVQTTTTAASDGNDDGNAANHTGTNTTTAPTTSGPPVAYGTLTLGAVELNPAGADADNEFLVVCNESGDAVGLKDWRVESRAGATTSQALDPSIVIPPGAGGNAVCKVIGLKGAFLPDENVVVALVRPDGTPSSATPRISDTQDDEGLWRKAASGEWVWDADGES